MARLRREARTVRPGGRHDPRPALHALGVRGPPLVEDVGVPVVARRPRPTDVASHSVADVVAEVRPGAPRRPEPGGESVLSLVVPVGDLRIAEVAVGCELVDAPNAPSWESKLM